MLPLLDQVTGEAFAVLKAKEATLAGHDFLVVIELAEALPEPQRGDVRSVFKNRARL